MNVLMPVDGSKLSLRALREAARFIDKSTCTVYLLFVIVPIVTEVGLSTLPADNMDIAINVLTAAEKEAQDIGLQIIEKDFMIYPEPASAICHYATEKHIDLIIMGSHGYHGLSKFLMGSVSEEVFKHARQTVVVIRNTQAC
jgi:nucleotide-binding universal stress UspA family protein